MHANIGDHIVLPGAGPGGCDRRGEIVDVLGVAGAPPYVVRWPDGHESLFTSSAAAFVEHLPDRTSVSC